MGQQIFLWVHTEQSCPPGCVMREGKSFAYINIHDFYNHIPMQSGPEW